MLKTIIVGGLCLAAGLVLGGAVVTYYIGRGFLR